MGKLFDRTRNLWIKARVGAPPFVQQTLISRLYEAKEIAYLLAKPRLPVCRLCGQGTGGPLAVTYIGFGFAKSLLKNMLFVEDPAEQRVGRVPFWRRNELVNQPSSDLTVICATKHLIHRLPQQSAVILPHFVHHILDVRGEWQDVVERFSRSVRKNEMRLVRKYGYEYDVSHDRQHFETFYHQMYLPTMKSRHGQQASPMSFAEAYQYFRHGCLFRVMRDGQWVSGGVCHSKQKILSFDIMGVRNADPELIHQGAHSTLYYATTHWANQQGYEAINFLGTGSFILYGRFQYKRKWGAAVSVPPHLHRRIWIKVQRVTPAVSQLLKENPMVIIAEDKKLHGLMVVDDLHDISAKTRRECEGRYITPGMASFLVRSIDYFTQESGIRIPDVVIPVLSGSNSGGDSDFQKQPLS